LIRISEEHYLYRDQNSSQTEKLFLFIDDLWKRRKEECLKGGRELVRVLQQMANNPRMEMVIKDLQKVADEEGRTLMVHIQESYVDTKQYLSIMIPSQLEQKINFMLERVKSENKDFYL